MSAAHPTTRTKEGVTTIPTGPHRGVPLVDIRAALSGLHFCKEALSPGERETLSYAEALLSVLDAEAGGFRH